jgi:hypothetical protein
MREALITHAEPLGSGSFRAISCELLALANEVIE